MIRNMKPQLITVEVDVSNFGKADDDVMVKAILKRFINRATNNYLRLFVAAVNGTVEQSGDKCILSANLGYSFDDENINEVTMFTLINSTVEHITEDKDTKVLEVMIVWKNDVESFSRRMARKAHLN